MFNSLRFSVFGIFIICNVLVATSAVWNLSLIQGSGATFLIPGVRSDTFSIFLGCAGLVLIFPIIFCDLAAKNVVITRIWFEMAWLSVSSVLNLAGAALATVAGFDHQCQQFLSGSFNDTDTQPQCVSSRVLQGFSWMASLTILLYFLLLSVSVLLRLKEDSTIWHCNVREFSWTGTLLRLKSEPGSLDDHVVEKKSTQLSLPRFRSRPLSIVAPQPKHLAIRRAILSYQSGTGLGSERDMEQVIPEESPRSPPQAAVAAPHSVERETVRARGPAFDSSALYPEHMQRALGSKHHVASSPTSSRESREEQTVPVPFPNPLGNWPQLNPPVRRLGDKHKLKGIQILPNAEPAYSV